MKRRLISVSASILVALFVLAQGAFARPETADEDWTLVAPLAEFMARDEPLMLRNAESEFSVYVPLSERIEVNEARLHLELTNSIALLEERSLLRVGVNGRVIAQIPLSPRQPAVEADLPIPVRLLETGFNRLTFSVAQHYTMQCEDPAAPELWTQIDSARSMLEIRATRRALDLRLSELDDIFDRRLWGPFELTILTPRGIETDAQLRAAALAAQGAALRLAYRPLFVRAEHARALDAPIEGRRLPGLEQELLPAGDSVLIGPASELAPLLGEEWAEKINGPRLELLALDIDPSRVVVVISGRDDAELDLAAQAFAHLNAPFPDTARLDVREVDLPALARYSAPGAISQDATYRFDHFDFRTVTLRGLNAGRAELVFNVPADLFSGRDHDVELRLHVAHGAGMRSDSVLNLMLNGNFENVIYLDREEGAVYRDYSIRIPLRSLQAGRNVLSFEPQLMPLVTGDCQAVQDENLLVTIFEDSTMEMPPAEHRVRLPDLGLLARTGYPYTAAPSGGQLALHLVDDSSASVSSALMLLARLAQIGGVPLHEAAVSFETAEPERDLIVIGTKDDLPKDLAGAAPISFGTEGARAGYETIASLQGRERALPSRLWDRVVGREPAETESRPELARIEHAGPLGRFALAMQFESPRESGRSVVTFVAEDSAILESATRRLVRPDAWGAMSGDTVLWIPRERAELSARRIGGDFAAGDASAATSLAFAFSTWPWTWVLSLVITVALLAFVSRRLLLRFKARHHGGATHAT